MVQQTEKKENEDIVLYVRVQYRRNSSWQGSVQWLDGRKKSTFRSALELSNLIYSVKQEPSGEGEVKSKLTKWKDKEDVS